jgi:hypothetical protein
VKPAATTASLHHLLLEDRHAERAFEHAAHGVGRIRDRLQSLPALQVRMHHAALDRPGAHDRGLDHEVIEGARPQPRQHVHLRTRLDLEHAERIALAQHVVDARALGGNLLHRHRRAAESADVIERAPDAREHAQRQHVDLEQAERIEVVLVPLDHGAVGHRRVLDRHQAVEPVARDDEAARVLRQMARKAHQVLRQLHHLRDHRVVGVEAGLLQALGLDPAAVPPGHRLGQLVDLVERQAERLAHVAQRALGAVRVQRRGERGAMAAVLGIDVLHHFFAPLMLEVDVDVGRLVALLADEALEQHAHARRIDLGDAQAVAHRRVGRRAASLAQDALRARKADDVVHGEEVGLVGEVGDQRQFMLDRLAHLVRHAVGVTAAGLVVGRLAQPGGRRFARRHDLLRVLVAQFVEREAAALRDRERLGQQLRRVDALQPIARAQIALGIRQQTPAGLCQRRLVAHRGQHVLQPLACTRMHVHIACRHQRQAGPLRQRGQVRQRLRIVCAAHQLAGDPHPSRHQRRQPTKIRVRFNFLALTR